MTANSIVLTCSKRNHGRGRTHLRLGLAVVILGALVPAIVADETPSAELKTTQTALAAARARSRYYLALLRWKSNRPQEAMNVLRQVPEKNRELEWFLTQREFHGGERTCYGHTNPVDSVAFSPAGDLIASGGSDNRVRLWDARSGRLLKVWQGLDQDPNAARAHASSVTFSPDGLTLAAGCGYGSDIGFRGAIKVWNVKTGELVRKLEEKRWVIRIRFSKDGKAIGYSTLNNTGVMLWNLSTDSRSTYKVAESTDQLAWSMSSTGKYIVSGPRNSVARSKKKEYVLRVFDSKSGEELYSRDEHQAALSGFAFSPDDQLLASVDRTGKVLLWETATGKQVKSLTGHSPLMFSPDGTHLIVKTPGQRREPGSLRFENLKTGKAVTLKEPVFPYAPCPDGSRVVGVTGGRVKVWDIGTGEVVSTLNGYAGNVSDLSVSPDGAWLVTGGRDHTVRMWDLRSSTEGWAIAADDEVAFSPDGKTVATAGASIQLWNADDRTKLRDIRDHTKRVTSIAFSPDGKQIASSSLDGTVRVFEVSSGKELSSIRGHSSAVKSVSFDPTGKRVVSGGYDKTVQVWDWQNQKSLHVWNANPEFTGFPGRPKKGTDFAHGVTWSPNGKWVLSLYDSVQTGPYWNRAPAGIIRVWDAANGQELSKLSGHRWAVTSVAFSPNSRWMASAGKDSTIRIWDTQTWQETGLLEGHSGPVHDLTFGSNDRILSVGGDGTMRIWDRADGEELKVYGKQVRANASAFSVLAKRNRIVVVSQGMDIRAKQGAALHAWLARPAVVGRVVRGPQAPMTINQDGTLIASASGNTVKLWDTRTGKESQNLQGHQSRVRCLAFSSDGTRLLTGSQASVVRMWDARVGAALREFKTKTPYLDKVAFHPDGKTVLAENTFDKRLAWDMKSGVSVPIKDWPKEVLDPPNPRWQITALEGHVLVMDTQSPHRQAEEDYMRVKTAPAERWHQRQAENAEKEQRWYSAVFHRAWQVRIAPDSAEAQAALRRAREKAGNKVLLPPVVGTVE